MYSTNFGPEETPEQLEKQRVIITNKFDLNYIESQIKPKH